MQEFREAQSVDLETQEPSQLQGCRGTFIAIQEHARPPLTGMAKSVRTVGGQRRHRLHSLEEHERCNAIFDKLISSKQGFEI